MKEIAEISDEELDALLDTPETEARNNAAPKTYKEAVREHIRSAGDPRVQDPVGETGQGPR